MISAPSGIGIEEWDSRRVAVAGRTAPGWAQGARSDRPQASSFGGDYGPGRKARLGRPDGHSLPLPHAPHNTQGEPPPYVGNPPKGRGFHGSVKLFRCQENPGWAEA